MARIEFSSNVRRIIAARSGYRCSVPTCDRITIGPGTGPHEVSTSGVAAHIFSASEGGPRGQGGLTDDELAQPDNGIWVCAKHSRVIDANSGRRYAPAVLLSYKQLQESRIAREHEGLKTPPYWIHEMSLERSPLFAQNQNISFAKVNLLIGHNESGKTAICEWLSAFSDLSELQRWRHGVPNKYPINAELHYLDPEPHRLRVSVEHNGGVKFSLDGAVVPLVPIPLKVVFLRHTRFVNDPNVNELQLISDYFSVDTAIIRNLISDVNNVSDSHVRNLQLLDDTEGTLLVADIQGTKPGLSFRRLSGSEQKRVVLELAIVLCSVLAKHQPTILVLDTVLVGLDPHWFDYYALRLAHPSRPFQTIAVIPTRSLDIEKLHWWGWQIIRTMSSNATFVIDQTIRNDPKPLG